MIHKADHNVREKLVPMFEHMDSTIVLSYLQGHMGDAWVDNLENPTVAQITVGIFVFYAGNPSAEEAEELLHNLPEFTLAIVDSDEWKNRIETIHKGSYEKFHRFRFNKDPQNLNRVRIHNLLSALPEEYEIKKIDKEIASSLPSMSSQKTLSVSLIRLMILWKEESGMLFYIKGRLFLRQHHLASMMTESRSKLRVTLTTEGKA